MPIYVYETIPERPGEKPKVYEVEQGMNDAPLTVHPYTGEPLRRVILGGYGVLSSGGDKNAGNGNSGACGPGCCCG